MCMRNEMSAANLIIFVKTLCTFLYVFVLAQAYPLSAKLSVIY